MTFFELYNIIKNNQLKFSKLRLMDDNNEGLGVALKSQLPTSFNPGFNSSHKDIVDYHSQIKDHTYITCWSKEKDSIAMWLLYSKNKDYIRVRTTTTKLKLFADKFMKDNFFIKHLKSPLGTLQTIDPSSEVKDVEYVNFNVVLEEIKRLHKQQKQEVELLYKQSLSDVDKEKELIEILRKTKKESNNLIHDPSFLKDEAYKHETEVRASINIFRRNDLPYEKWEENKHSNESAYLFGTATTDFSNSTNNILDILNIPVDNHFIEEICFDPRMPDYQKKIYKDILNLTDKKIVNTSIFGTLSDVTSLGMSYHG